MTSKNRYIVIAVCALMAFLAGCATGPAYKQASINMPKLKATNGRIFIYRSTAFGGLIQPSVLLNGVEVGTAKPNGVYFVDRPPGNYEVSTSSEVEKKATFTLSQGERKYVRVNASFGVMVARIVPELVDEKTAEEEMQDLSYLPAEGRR